ncbi:Os03g0213500 [Oryza sativa Japonica Group]|jgi:hypothetical protein|uniref:Expressed protein n=5 Tax=Oryza TaxID=4527 RepID=Q10Q14_ORYSJ|nr:uncharacterized protein LOC4332046 [Oryza sativa Japonica Group]XP_015628707.1 uncharacterized protein LOC4332046 [Oryza sativa Japonica Group]XP_052146498.1 uncharacterized protein LOC127765601 [Oryza glaberrima]KAB8090786.1 hypothetical protein EE612_016093 [Oryza sativa]ABF94621.1 expressed protein [Oryza sativa Japonica Group]EAZ26046.1 hypothetical protein OsJ_09900 [Oryza sativa Japonica Group]KAF2937978.1 hypothetical protein DAI22_03g087500 [Oryza sativa Japonica Group]BAF11277.1 |eukprot:NP_001049363.1 Os03g0213500 [Oryza sativa Japonica Group]
MDSVVLECGDISASQEELLAHSSFLNGGDDGEVFSTPPTTQEDAITMCTLPFTQSQSPAPAPLPSPAAVSRTTPGCSSSEDNRDDEMSDIVKQRRRPRVCTRKVRWGAKIRTPTPSPDRTTSEVENKDGDPLYKAVLMIPTRDSTPAIPMDLIALARQRGLF